ncbi:MAG: DNA gyrase inhibitor YacG [Ideonella sp.]
MSPESPMPSRTPLQVRCPACGEMTVYSTTNTFRPFCSLRCQQHDFGAWASENYRVPAKPEEDEPDR